MERRQRMMGRRFWIGSQINDWRARCRRLSSSAGARRCRSWHRMGMRNRRALSILLGSIFRILPALLLSHATENAAQVLLRQSDQLTRLIAGRKRNQHAPHLQLGSKMRTGTVSSKVRQATERTVLDAGESQGAPAWHMVLLTCHARRTGLRNAIQSRWQRRGRVDALEGTVCSMNDG